MEENSNAIIMGQGVNDFKGIFGTTQGLQEKFGDNRVFDVPLAEEATTGVGIGASLNGLYPIQTHIRADFSLVCMNQIINLASKYRYMFGGIFEVPMLIRLVVGRSWGQGAQHSQSLQSTFSHFPGLTVILPSHPDTILSSYLYAAEKYMNPVISIEHRLMYDLGFAKGVYATKSNPLHSSYIVREGNDVTIVATSIMVLETLRAAEHLSKSAGISCEVIDIHSASHPQRELIIESIRKTKKLIIADTSWKAYGVGAEVCRWVLEKDPTLLIAPAKTIGMAPAPCPTAKSLEDLYYPNLFTLSDDIANIVTGNSNHGIPLPDEKSMADVYKKFKGPF